MAPQALVYNTEPSGSILSRYADFCGGAFPYFTAPKTPPPTRCKRRAASAVLKHSTASPFPLWLQSPLLKVEIECLKWKPHP